MMRYWFLLIFIPLFLPSNAQDQEEKHPIGIGVRVGDFNGLSAKYYLIEEGINFELNIGRSYFFGDNYEQRFEKYADDHAIDYVVYYPNGTQEGASLGFKFNVSKSGILADIPHFYWYGGVGFQLRNFVLDHEYGVEVTAANSTQTRVSDAKLDGVKHFSYGIDFILGSEYIFQEFPLSIFVDISTFVEAGELRQKLMGQMGLGVRVHF